MMTSLAKLWGQVRLIAYSLLDPKAGHTIRKIQNEKISYLNTSELIRLSSISRKIEKQKIPGMFIEAGCAMGGSAIALTTSKSAGRPFHIYDTFGMIPPPSGEDGEDAHQRYEIITSHQSKGIGSTPYYGYLENLYEIVQNTLIRFGFDPGENNIHLIKGLFENTINIEDPVALAHLDCDWYDSVMVCLRRIEPHLSIGGVLIIDDYFHWSGSKKAVDEYFSGEKRQNYSFTPASHLVITRIK